METIDDLDKNAKELHDAEAEKEASEETIKDLKSKVYKSIEENKDKLKKIEDETKDE